MWGVVLQRGLLSSSPHFNWPPTGRSPAGAGVARCGCVVVDAHLSVTGGLLSEGLGLGVMLGDVEEMAQKADGECLRSLL